jgi:primosomal protein N' (replication factor Y)
VRACQVVPDIPSFAVDDGFTYLVPDDLDVSVGSRVRVRVSGRRLKGFVTAIFDAPRERRLLALDGLSGTVPGFDEERLTTLRWAASHYVSPLSVILRRTMPPNVARGHVEPVEGRSHTAPTYTVQVSGAHEHPAHLERIVGEATAGGHNVMVIAPTFAEVSHLAGTLSDRFGDLVVTATSATPASDATHAWVRAATTTPTVLVGTREVMLWPVTDLRATVVIEDARRVMKSPATPTLGVREVITERARVEGFDVTFLTPVPSPETIALGADIRSPAGREWPLVEIADRGEEPPSRALLLDRTRSAIVANLKRGARAFVLVPTRGYAPAFRCVRCGELRRCTECGTAATKTQACRRCENALGACITCHGRRFEPLGAGIGSVRDAIARSVGDAVGVREDARPITVGSERDVIGHPPVSLAVSVDLDGLAHAPTYRAAEDALRLHVRVAQLVQRGRGNRLVVQTALPAQPVVEALRSGTSQAFLADLLKERRRSGFPPFGELIALEIDHEVDANPDVVEMLGPVATVLGPAPLEDRNRWLIQGLDLTEARIRLRRLVGSLRDRGARVRVDADPTDL